ncbi:WcaG Nucleoside-diphosphate-sugar epimerases [uncultured Caudovirales phage]|uniref:WcaG Nucleoside-diphosphate-sugar epimerases n=1 Tax=uncultured Caudovirales phage TaxID=2100421 RepID=A0A6J5L6Y5_9CAUD|nr:WcaG Nucleoside-diphosphate-sugar epimerases [uncultured Caudovirales phage]
MESKVLLLGGSGLVGSFLKGALCEEYELYAPTSSELNLLDPDSVKYFFRNNYFDVVVNCAANTNSQMTPFDDQAFKDNIAMFNNVWVESDHYGRLINFGSGGEFDRSQNIFNAKEETLFLSAPQDHYGMSKNAISRVIFESDNCYTLRLFGVFGPNEPEYRLLKKVLSGGPVVLEDKYFDYYYVEDILPVVRYYIDSKKPKFKDLNVVYPTKTLLSYFVKQFCQMHKLDGKNVKIAPTRGLNYTGSSVRIEELKLKLLGYEQGLERYK